MSADYNGLTINEWSGTWVPNAKHPIVLDTDIRGSLQSISGALGDQLLDIPGQRLQEGMLVYVKNTYISASGISYIADTYYTYRSLSGESRNPLTGALSNTDANWVKIQLDVGGIQDADTLQGNPASYFYSPVNKPVVIERYNFTNALRWTVVHNKNTVKFIETLTDMQGNRFFAKTRIIDENSFEVVLTSAISGTVDVMFVV